MMTSVALVFPLDFVEDMVVALRCETSKMKFYCRLWKQSNGQSEQRHTTTKKNETNPTARKRKKRETHYKIITFHSMPFDSKNVYDKIQNMEYVQNAKCGIDEREG